MNRMKKMGISEIVICIVFMALSCIIFFFGNNAIVTGTIVSAIIGIWQITGGCLYCFYTTPYQEERIKQ